MDESTEATFQSDETFWTLIDRTRIASQGDVDKQAELIIDELVQYPVQAIFEFDFVFAVYMDKACRRLLWDAAYIINCGCGDDSFSDFRAWLIAQGQAIYDAALENPETLVDIVEPGDETDGFYLYDVPTKAYERKTGQDMPNIIHHRTVLKDDGLVFDWKQPEAEREAELALCFPKLFAKFGDCAAWI